MRQGYKLMCLPPHSDLEEVLLGVIWGPVVHLYHSISERDLHPRQYCEDGEDIDTIESETKQQLEMCSIITTACNVSPGPFHIDHCTKCYHT